MPDATTLSPGSALLIATPLDWREACLSVPAMRALQRHVSRVRVLCPDNQLAFWALSGFREGVAYPAKAGPKDIARRIENVDQVLLWERGAAAEACQRANVARRYGPAELGKLLTDPVTINFKPGPIRHRVQFYLELADALGADAFVPENFVAAATGTERSEKVLLVPDSDAGRHYEWPVERWEEVARYLQEHGAQIEIATTGPAGKALAEKLEGATTTSLETPALETLAGYLVCITADGTLPHFAAHVGTTCVVLFGPGEPEWMRPLGKQHVIVRRKVECSPCFASRCQMDLRCQQDLPVSEVIRGIKMLS